MSYETKCCVCFYTSIVYTSIPFQILRNRHTKVFTIIYIFKDSPSKEWTALICLIRFLVSCIMLHFTGWNLIPHCLTHLPSWSISCLSFAVSSILSIWRQHIQSSANRRISDSITSMTSIIYNESNRGSRTALCGTPDKTGAHWNFVPFVPLTTINVKDIWKQRTHYRLENGSLGYIETHQ